jgi:hypothetical protein
MGTGPPKSESEQQQLDQQLAEMEDAVKNAILIGTSDDLVLLSLLEVTIASEKSGLPIFANPMSEPAFYRKYFRRWVKEGLWEADQAEDSHHQNKHIVLGEEAPPPASLP